MGKEPRTAEGWIRQAEFARQKADWPEVDRLCAEGLERFPDNMDLHHRYLFSAKQQEKTMLVSEIRARARRAARHCSHNAQLFRSAMGMSQRKEERDNAWIEALCAWGMENFPGDAKLLNLCESGYQILGNDEGLRRVGEFKRRIGMYDDTAAILARIKVLSGNNDWRAVDQVCKEGLLAFPDNPELNHRYMVSAKAQIKTLPQQEKTQRAEQALWRCPYDAAILRGAMDISLVREGRDEAWIEELCALGMRNFPGDDGVLGHCLRGYAALKKSKEALDVFAHMSRIGAATSSDEFLVAICAATRLRRNEVVAGVLPRLMEGYPEYLDIQLFGIRSYVAMGQFTEALTGMREYMEWLHENRQSLGDGHYQTGLFRCMEYYRQLAEHGVGREGYQVLFSVLQGEFSPAHLAELRLQPGEVAHAPQELSSMENRLLDDEEQIKAVRTRFWEELGSGRYMTPQRQRTDGHIGRRI